MFTVRSADVPTLSAPFSGPVSQSEHADVLFWCVLVARGEDSEVKQWMVNMLQQTDASRKLIPSEHGR